MDPSSIPSEAWAVGGTIAGSLVGVLGTSLIQAQRFKLETRDRDRQAKREAYAEVLALGQGWILDIAEPLAAIRGTGSSLTGAKKRAVLEVKDLLRGLTISISRAQLLSGDDAEAVKLLHALFEAVVVNAREITDGNPAAVPSRELLEAMGRFDTHVMKVYGVPTDTD